MNFRILLALVVISLLSISCKSDRSPHVLESDKTKEDKTVITSKKKPKPKTSVPVKLEKPNVKLSSTVSLNSIDYQLIDARLFQKINHERKRLGLPLFKNNNTLKKAAKIHNDYMVKADVLDHNERGTSTPSMKDRVTKVGGKFRTAGENIQYEGFTIRTTNGVESIVAPTYEALAEQLWQNWKTSPPHYKNLTNPDFIYLGTALKWSDKKTAVFATQVYGG